MKLLSLKGCIVTIDAMGCQKAITCSTSSPTVLTCTDKSPRGFKKSHATDFTQKTFSYSLERVHTNNHGRIESREHGLMEVPEYLKRSTKSSTNLQTIAMVRRKRQVGEKVSEETHYYISSLPLSAGARNIAKAICSHWAVENCLHWSLDVAFREDASQVRKDEGPANLACIRRLALTQLKRETSLKVGIKNKRSRAGWDYAYMETVLKTGVRSI